MTITGLNGAVRFSLAALAAGLLAAAPVHAETETRAVNPFHAVSFAGSWSVDVTAGKPQSVVIEGDKDTIAHVKTEIVDGELRVSLEHSFFDSVKPGRLSAHITLPTLDAFSRSGSGDATLTGLDAPKIALASSGSGAIKAEGHADSITLAENGSGSADLAGLRSDDAVVTINGSGDAVIQAARALAVTINGRGRLEYVGEPRVTTVVNGSGAVKKR